MSFGGFSDDGLALLTAIGAGGRDHFRRERKRYQSLVLAPAKALVVDLGAWLRAHVSPELEALPKTNGSLAPIHNDRRFAKDKPPYKDHLLLRFWEGADKKTSSTLFVRISPKRIGFAVGVAAFDVAAWREAVAGDGAALQCALDALGEGVALDVVGQVLRRVPQPYDADHPQAALLRHKSFQARWPEPAPPAIGDEGFVPWCGERLARAVPVHRWLVQHL